MRKCFLFPALLALPCALHSQQAPAAPAPYTLRVQSRLIVEDVTVLDRKGNAVTGLPASAFQVLDDGKPQTVQNFQEISGAPADQPRPTHTRRHLLEQLPSSTIAAPSSSC